MDKEELIKFLRGEEKRCLDLAQNHLKGTMDEIRYIARAEMCFELIKKLK
ncbi:hypothetical protein LCGC14_2999060 [marine sediment metagenome]|uniref:Uncharacterized protein n=1 Tax=marine sediment metagenome TaxID=412755 RepID=A0A0F8Z971_9ZZZZ